MKKNRYLVQSRAVNGKKWRAIVALTLLMLGATILALLIEHANAPAAVIASGVLWV